MLKQSAGSKVMKREKLLLGFVMRSERELGLIMDGGSSSSSSSPVKITNLSGVGVESVSVHQVPCCIKYNGHTSVSNYFKPIPSGMEVDGLKVEEAYFRVGNYKELSFLFLMAILGGNSQGASARGKKKDAVPGNQPAQDRVYSLTEENPPEPSSVRGFVVGKKSDGKSNGSVEAEKTSKSWETKAKFESLTLWNHDSLPSQEDTFLRSFHWLTVANALHQPVTAEEIQAVSITKQPQD